MSMYSMMHGTNPLSDVLLAMLGLKRGDVGRFRDCYLTRGDERSEIRSAADPLRIVVYTRNGGGNRDDYKDVTDALEKHPCYLTDYDADHDSTYASYAFSVPIEFATDAEVLADAGGQHDATPSERFEKLIASMEAAKP